MLFVYFPRGGGVSLTKQRDAGQNRCSHVAGVDHYFIAVSSDEQPWWSPAWWGWWDRAVPAPSLAAWGGSCCCIKSVWVLLFTLWCNQAVGYRIIWGASLWFEFLMLLSRFWEGFSEKRFCGSPTATLRGAGLRCLFLHSYCRLTWPFLFFSYFPVTCPNFFSTVAASAASCVKRFQPERHSSIQSAELPLLRLPL